MKTLKSTIYLGAAVLMIMSFIPQASAESERSAGMHKMREMASQRHAQKMDNAEVSKDKESEKIAPHKHKRHHQKASKMYKHKDHHAHTGQYND